MNSLSSQGWGEENVGRKQRREREEELSSDVALAPNPFSRQPLPLQFLLGPSSCAQTLLPEACSQVSLTSTTCTKKTMSMAMSDFVSF